MSDRIQLSYDQLADANAQIRGGISDMDGKLGDLRRMLDNLDWEGDDQVAYEQKKLEWDQGYAKILEILEGVAGAVKKAEERYAATEAANAMRFG